MKTNFHSFACVLLTFLTCNSMLVFAQGDATFSIEKSFPGVSEVVGDGMGNIYISGIFNSSVQIGDFNLTENGPYNGVYVARLDNSGNPVWATPFWAAPHGGTFSNTFLKYYNNKVYFAGSSNSGPLITSMLELDYVTGEILRTFAPPCYLNITSLDVDGTGIYLTGGDPFGACGARREVGYVVKRDHNYDIDWIKSYVDVNNPTEYEGIPFAGALSKTHDSYLVTGWLNGRTVFSTSFSKSGNEQYSRFLITESLYFNEPFSSEGRSIKMDSHGNVVLFGHYYRPSGQAFYDSESGFGLPATVGGRDIFLTKFDDAGNLLWNISFPGTGNQRARELVIDDQDNIYIIGDLSLGTITMGDKVITGSGNFIAKLDAAGNVLLAKVLGGSFDNIFVNNNGKIYTVGGGVFAELSDVPEPCTDCIQYITFNEIEDKKFNDAPFTITAFSSSLLPVSFELISGPILLKIIMK